MAADFTDAIRVFYCYAHEDQAMRDELEKHLGILKRHGQIIGWHDRDISAGNEWEHEINSHLNLADIILLLVSPDFIHSEYCYSVEMSRALERHYAGEAYVIPIILRPVDWDDAPFSKLQVLPTNKRPITSWPNADEAFLDVARGIRIAVKGYVSQKVKEQSTNKNDAHAEIIHGNNTPRSYELEHHREGLDAYEEALRLDPNNVEAHIGKGNALYYLKNYTLASGTYHQAILIDPGNVEIYNFRGQSLYSAGYYEQAFEVFKQALHVDPKNVMAYNGIASTLSALERFAEAIDISDQAIYLDPSNALAYNNKGVALRNLKRYEKALAVFQEAIRIAPDYVALYINQGNTLNDLNRYNEAFASYDQAIRLDPSNAHGYNGKGNALYKLHRYEEALVAYDQAILMDPTLAVAYNNNRSPGKIKRSQASL
jgi:tetratricopeptide (TPR) repeat protein